MKTGDMRLFAACDDVAVVVRRIALGRDAFGNPAPDETVLAALNRAGAPRRVEINHEWLGGKLTLELPAQHCLVIENP